MSIRENIVDKQRVVSNMLKSQLFPKELKPKLTIILKDINSLFEHTRFQFRPFGILAGHSVGFGKHTTK